MAKKRSKTDESTTITTRIDIIAKDIINRSSQSYREILEKMAYSSINTNNEEFDVRSQKEIKELEEDISDLLYFKKQNDSKIQDLKDELKKLEDNNKRLDKSLSKKKTRLSIVKQNIENLEQVIQDYETNISYGIQDAVVKVEETLRHNHELRQHGPRARVKESEIKRICQEYKVTVSEVLPGIDPKYLDCMEGYQKYI